MIKRWWMATCSSAKPPSGPPLSLPHSTFHGQWFRCLCPIVCTWRLFCYEHEQPGRLLFKIFVRFEALTRLLFGSQVRLFLLAMLFRLRLESIFTLTITEDGSSLFHTALAVRKLFRRQTSIYEREQSWQIPGPVRKKRAQSRCSSWPRCWGHYGWEVL